MSPTQRAYTIMRPASQDEQDGAEYWQKDASCRNEDPELFFIKEKRAEAKAICRNCPVVMICRADAIEQRDFGGVRGALSGRQLMLIVKGKVAEPTHLEAAQRARREQGRVLVAQIAELAIAGRSAREIAVEVNRAEDTVHHHLTNLRNDGTIPREAGRIPRAPLGPVQKHGDRAGYGAHKRRGEEPCDECKAGYSVVQRAFREARKAAGL